jgi:hypothetical protein
MPNDNSQQQNTNEKYDFPSLDLIFEFTKERISNQKEQVTALDNRVNFVLGSATTVVSAALILQAVLLSSHNLVQLSYCAIFVNQFLKVLPLLVLLFLYLLVMLTAFLGYKIRYYKQVPDPNELYRTYLRKEKNVTKAEVFRAMLEAYNENIKTIKNKAIWVKTAFFLFIFEVIVLTVVLLVQVGC